ncbi:MAG: 50S ribosomal protein L25 [Patescibacteria group bacterium]
METITLKAKIREAKGKQNNKLRKENMVPAVVYGHDTKPLSLAVNYFDLKKVFAKAGESSLVDLIIAEKKPIKVLIQAIQFDSKSDQMIHADFHQVKMTEKITTEVALNFVGESPAVKGLSGVLVKSLDRLKITCLPADLVHEIEVDLSRLKTFEDIIYVRDLKIPANIEVLDQSGEAVAKVIPPRSEEELKALEEKPEEKVEEVEKVEKEKKEEEEGEEKKNEPAAPKTKEEKNG